MTHFHKNKVRTRHETVNFFAALIFFFAFILLLAPNRTKAQDEFGKWIKPLESIQFKPILQLQLWASYSHGQRVFSDSLQAYKPVDNRFNIMLRRARAGFQVEPYPGLLFRFVGAFDLIGRDIHAAHTGASNTGGRPEFDIWEARIQWKVLPKRESLYLNAGWFRPNFSRESLTSPWNVSSMEKAWSMNYVRRHLVGFGPGAAPGINLGGLFYRKEKFIHIGYNLGLYIPQYQALLVQPERLIISPLFTGRIILHLGQPEFTTYSLGHKSNFFNERKGITLGIGAVWQGKTNLFSANYGTQFDFLFNWGSFNLDGDFNFLFRQGTEPCRESNAGFHRKTSTYQTGHIRNGVNLQIGSYYIEPVFMFVFLNGPMELSEQEDAFQVLSRSGQHFQYAFGINWYLNRQKLKLALHYTINRGGSGESGDGSTGNNYLYQAGAGPIQRGHWLGLGFNLQL